MQTQGKTTSASAQDNSSNISDADWFARHPDAQLRIREIIPEIDGISKSSAKMLCVGVSRTGCTGFMYRGALNGVRQ